MQRRDRGIAQSLGLPLTKCVKESRVLLVGAGGIGCEVLKNLVCCGFGSLPGAASSKKPGIVVIDLDTIDLSNLNRQFLFRKRHIKKPKAFVAKETASQFNPSVNIDAHHASIFDSQYNVEFFETFDLVFNALDNLAARRHVNRMCLAADVPLIESGTTGFNGQVQAIKKGVTECYDCNPKPVQKSFPICTIRSTPSQPIHCIVWAKSYLLPELFGTSEEESADVAVTEGDSADEIAKLKEEAEALKNVRRMMGKSEFAQEVFDKVFHDDIERLRSMTEMWQSRKAPKALSFDGLKAGLETDIIEHGRTLTDQDQVVWSVQDDLAVFTYALDTLSNRCLTGEKVIEFDKDDKDTLDFVASAANLRSHIFDIPLHSEWVIKQMAGNIIPAIATSNALTASLCVMEGFKILRSQLGSVGGKEEATLGGAKMVFLNSRSTERMITTQTLAPPKADCPVCSPVYAKLRLRNGEGGEATLQELVDLLKEKVGHEDFAITTEAGIIYDPDLEDNLEKPLKDYVTHGNSFITVSDEGDEAKVDLVLSTVTQSGEEAELQLLPDSIMLPFKPKKELPAETNGHAGEIRATPEVVAAPTTTSSAGAKRKREADEESESVKKRVMASKSEVHVVDDDGAILLDDD
ncbi:E1 ubiquitin-activating protein uba2 [Friedmanniomyces endolithicus]|nr:E1 ubiquitin-activating protein uba2 [Friedmanniomyces endolithicus]KAK0776999.1 E1 ubiquitin-activating protein uba2 [Friedmanniomyces endolithicus]KAK0794635.1 E1 ubiquitin-activating protein uba2 [Friedmanniomyces endolithicus]KAK0804315.1 E1 ubiquitin-activating protein uba2 [Friedmanniomyces endolithicus]KAK0858840.1 E1 ubiquitin-activating protein uba2 [Friedmanniomyces endolithicus]